MTVRSGHAIDGPRKGKLIVTQSPGTVPCEGGFYVFTPAKGPTPSGWRWVSKGPKNADR